MNLFLLFKALHVIGFVSWFAGLFYVVRIFIYDVEAANRPAHERDILQPHFRLMQRRVFSVILHPALGITLVGGAGMLAANPAYLQQPWMWWKLGLVGLLVGYHFWCNRIRQQLTTGATPMTAVQLRLFNEVATLFLVAIAILAVYQRLADFAITFAVMIGVGILLMVGIKAYKKAREKNPRL